MEINHIHNESHSVEKMTFKHIKSTQINETNKKLFLIYECKECNTQVSFVPPSMQEVATAFSGHSFSSSEGKVMDYVMFKRAIAWLIHTMQENVSVQEWIDRKVNNIKLDEGFFHFETEQN